MSLCHEMEGVTFDVRSPIANLQKLLKLPICTRIPDLVDGDLVQSPSPGANSSAILFQIAISLAVLAADPQQSILWMDFWIGTIR